MTASFGNKNMVGEIEPFYLTQILITGGGGHTAESRAILHNITRYGKKFLQIVLLVLHEQ